MNYAGEAADQVVRMSIQGAEVVLRLSGSAAERISAFLYTVMKDQQKTMGKTRLVSMLKSGKELTVFTIKAEDLSAFTAEAKRYGVLFCTLKEKAAREDGTLDVMVYKDDASKINRIVERLSLATVEVETAENPTKEKGESRDPSEPTSKSKEISGKAISDASAEPKKSVRKTIEELRAERKDEKAVGSRTREKELKEKLHKAGKVAQERAERVDGR